MRKCFIVVGLYLSMQYGAFGQELKYDDWTVDVSKVINQSQRIRSFVDQTEAGFDFYYLIQQRDGSDLRIDSDEVFFSDIAQPDVESEGFIRFVDKDTQLVGLLNEYGEVVIPPSYTAMTAVQNGIIAALVDGEKVNIGHEGDSHWILVGGETILINTQNDLLVKDFKEPDMELDYYSLQVLDSPIANVNYDSFLGVNGRYYNFLNLEKVFKSFVLETFLPSTTTTKWQQFLSDKVVIKIELDNGNIGDYIQVDKKKLLTKYSSKLAEIFKSGRASGAGLNWQRLILDLDSWSAYVDMDQIEAKKQHLYFNNDGTWKRELYPNFELTIKEDVGEQTRSNHFEFYRNIDGDLVLHRISLRYNTF